MLKNKKYLIIVALLLCLLLPLSPLKVFADETENLPEENEIIENSNEEEKKEEEKEEQVEGEEPKVEENLEDKKDENKIEETILEEKTEEVEDNIPKVEENAIPNVKGTDTEETTNPSQTPELDPGTNNETPVATTASILYTTHVQNIGWQSYAKDGEMAGTSGRSLRLEGIKIKLEGQEYTGDIEYRTHIQDIGWEKNFKKNDEMSGTSGRSLRLEAIEIRLTGEMAANYDVYYRVHAQNFGWLGWARNGEASGTAGYSYRLEGIEIKLIKKGTIFSEYGKNATFYDSKTGKTIPLPDGKLVYYTTHVQDVGWQNYAYDGGMAGTSGKSLRLEGIKIKINTEYEGNIEYKTHIQNIGWESSYKKNGEMSGTSGKALRLEAIKIKLTGEVAEHYDVYYRVHAQNFGWLGWARNDESSGTAGYAYRLEGIEIKLIEKGTIFKEYGSSTIFYDKTTGAVNTIGDDKIISISSSIQSKGWQNYVQDGMVSGTTGKALRIEGIKLKLINQKYEGDIEYKSYLQNYGWESDFKKNDEVSGLPGKKLRIEAIQIKLTGEISDYYDIYYRVHAENFGWLGWARNGESAGSTGYAYRIEAIETKVLPKGEEFSEYGKKEALKDIGGWKVIDGKTYYYYSDGSVAKSFAKIDGVRYEFSNSGELQHSNIKIVADVSFHNGTIDFDKLWASGQIDGIIFRIGWSLGMDRKFTEYVNNAKRLGIPYSVYHFSIAENAGEAADKARYLVNWYKNNNLNTDMGVFYDLEEWHNEDYSHSDATITPETYDAIISSYKSVLNTNGISVSVYAGKNFAETRFTDYGRSQIGWIAQYNYRCTYGGTYRGWQYTSTATLPGINGNVDMSVFYS